MNFPKSTYEYWVKRFDRPDRDEELAEAIDKFIKYYNEDRIKEKLNWMSPVEYRSHHWDNKEKTQISLR